MNERTMRRSEAYVLIAAEKGRLTRYLYRTGDHVDYIDSGIFGSSRAPDADTLEACVAEGWLMQPPSGVGQPQECLWRITAAGQEALERYRSSPPPREKFTGKRKRQTGEKKRPRSFSRVTASIWRCRTALLVPRRKIRSSYWGSARRCQTNTHSRVSPSFTSHSTLR